MAGCRSIDEARTPVFEIQNHIVWIAKFRHKILRGRLAERTRDLIRQTCEARGVMIVCGAVWPDHVTCSSRRRRNRLRRNWCSTSEDGHRGGLRRNHPNSGGSSGDNTCGGEDISARQSARWMSGQCRSISRTRSGTMALRVQDHRADQALRRLSAGDSPGGFSRNATFSRKETYRL